jgi:hypothetical protein
MTKADRESMRKRFERAFGSLDGGWRRFEPDAWQVMCREVERAVRRERSLANDDADRWKQARDRVDSAIVEQAKR